MLARKWQLLARLEKRRREAAQRAQEAAKKAHEAAEQLEAEKQKAVQKAQEAEGREIIMISGIIVGVLIAIVATLGVTTWWVRVRRVAKLYQVAAVQTWPPAKSR